MINFVLPSGLFHPVTIQQNKMAGTGALYGFFAGHGFNWLGDPRSPLLPAWFDDLQATQDGDWMRITGVRRA